MNEWMDVYFWVESEQNLSFICVSSFIYSWGAERNSFFSFRTFIISMPWEKRKVESGMSYDRFGSALDTLPRFPLHIKFGGQRGGVEEIICKNRFNFKFIFAFTLHRHVYYIDFDIIAIILQTMMCFFPPPSFPICVFSSKSMFLKGEERTANLKAFHTLFKSIFHTKLGRFHQLCNVWENKPVALLWAAVHKFMFHFKYSALKNRVQVN